MPYGTGALKVPFLDDFSEGKTQAVSQARNGRYCWRNRLVYCYSVTRPAMAGEPIEQAVSGRGFNAAVDLSASMKSRILSLTRSLWIG